MTSQRSHPGRAGRRFRLRPVVALLVGACCGVVSTAVALQTGGLSGDAAPAARSGVQRKTPSAIASPDRSIGRPWSAPESPGSGAQDGITPTPEGSGERCTVNRLLVPSCGVWWGAAVSGFPQDKAVRAFEGKIGRPLAIYHDYHRGRDLFPTRTDIDIAREPGRTRMLLLSWKPAADGQTWAQVAAGSMDDHVDRLSAHIKQNFPERFWLALHHEPEDDVREQPGSGYTAADFRDMFRHVVQRFRANGVANVLFTVIFMGYSGHVAQPWFDELYPGDDVVDWIGYDAYAYATTRTFAELIDQAAPVQRRQGMVGFYRWVRRHLSDDKPIMLGEWGGTELSGNPADKAELYRSVGRQIRSFPGIKALVYWEHPHGPKFGDTRVDATPMALQAYRQVGLLPHFNPPVPDK